MTRYRTFCTCADSLQFLLVDEKKNSKFKLAPLELITNFENPSSTVTRLKDHKAVILTTLKMLTGIRL